MKKLGIFIGRFSPIHHGHLNVIKHACENVEKLLILIGSSNTSRNTRNPWTATEREQMILLGIHDYGIDPTKIIIAHLDDYMYNDNQWTSKVQEFATEYSQQLNDEIGEQVQCQLYGHDKDETTWYINAFPQWGEPDTSSPLMELNATQIRNQYFNQYFTDEILDGVTERVRNYLRGFKLSSEFKYIVDEYLFQRSHDDMWAKAPYPPTFNTVDSVVVQSGHILLIKRKAHPCPGTWALPGGYLNVNETQLDSAIRELREETCLKIPEKVLRGSIQKIKTFDDPKRSTRGRVITRAFLFQLDDNNPLPKVKGADDAEKAQWIPLSELTNMRHEMFEDHYHIINNMLNI